MENNSDATKELIVRAHDGDKGARDALVTENMGLVWSVARRFVGRGHELEDLFQIGVIGLIKAIDKFDSNFDVKLSTYAVPMITGEIKRFLRDDGMIKVSRSLKENAYRAKQIGEELSKNLGREPTTSEIAQIMDISVAEVAMALESVAEVESIHKTVYQSDGNGISLIEKLAPIATDSDTDKLLDNMLLSELMNKIGDDERKIIYYRYFLDKTQTEISKLMGISQVQISRLEKRILKKMREEM
ncbi:MAG: SigB/SigF/SigG family RNA polymerase sigma factor [Lachnospira sp.]|nr:SigB/SigF/SigG family RNA polymerase sigma factor [Lachnospira sp.]